MKKAQIIINIVGACLVFILFAADPFISWIIDRIFIVMPFWAWGLVGVALFEILFIIIMIRPSLMHNASVKHFSDTIIKNSNDVKIGKSKGIFKFASYRQFKDDLAIGKEAEQKKILDEGLQKYMIKGALRAALISVILIGINIISYPHFEWHGILVLTIGFLFCVAFGAVVNMISYRIYSKKYKK